MKNALKKIGVFGLICAVLSPFASIPKVNAAEDCKHYLNQYLFLDVTTGNNWEHYTKRNGSRTYTTFAYTFPEIASGQSIRIDKVGSLSLVDDDYSNLLAFSSEWNNLANSSDKTGLNKQARLGSINEYEYYSSSYESISYILHGYWGFENDDYIESTYSKELKDNINNDSWFKNHTIQGVLIEKDKENNVDFKVDFSGAVLNNNEFSAAYNRDFDGFDSDMDDYFQKVVNDISNGASPSSDSIEKGYVWKSGENYYINIGIERSVSEKASTDGLNNLNFGYVSTESNDENYGYIFSTSSSEIENSYDALVSHDNGDEYGENKWATIGLKTKTEFEEEVDINTSESYYWPAILNVEYSVCNTASNVEVPSTGKWTLKYKEGVEDTTQVTNMPSPKTVEREVGTAIEVSSTKPSREGYSFNGWKVCDGTKTYKAGDKVENTQADVVVELCAQWGQTGSEENPKQGVISYVLGFAAIGVIAGSIYIISKKKNLFKQI